MCVSYPLLGGSFDPRECPEWAEECGYECSDFEYSDNDSDFDYLFGDDDDGIAPTMADA